MFRLSIYYLFILSLFFSCTDTPTTTENSSSTSGGSNSYISLDFGSHTNTSVDMVINTSEDISGFQFTIVGPDITGFDGGFSEQYGFSIANNSETGIIIGYSLSGSVIPAGSDGVLTTLFFENQNLNVCIEDVIFSDPNAIALDINFIGDCVEY